MTARDSIINRILPDLKRWRSEQQRVITNTDADNMPATTVLEETYYFDKWMSYWYERQGMRPQLLKRQCEELKDKGVQ